MWIADRMVGLPMPRPTTVISALSKLAMLAALSVIAFVGLRFYNALTADKAKVAALEVKNAELTDVITRLGAETRMADLVVSEQSRQADGKLKTSLLMVEYDKQGRALPPRAFTVVGERVHLDALVIKFDAADIQKPNNALTGHAFLLFEKIYGDAQAPADGQAIDSPAAVPSVLRQSDASAGGANTGDFERSLWKNFWQLVDDESLREKYGVRVAHGVGVFEPFKPGYRYTVTLQADGNVTLHNEPLPEILNAAMKRDGAG